MKIKFKKHIHISLVIVAAIIFFIGTSAYNYQTQFFSPTGENDFVKWSSPDETANFIFSKLYAQTGELIITENYNIIAADIMHPRSIRADYGRLKPMSFLGMILGYGYIAKAFGYKVLPYLTPFFASLSLIFFYLLVKTIFNKSNGLISVFILASFPPFIYYSARSMFHNVFFVSMLIIAAYLLTLAFYKFRLKARLKKRLIRFFKKKNKLKQAVMFKKNYKLVFFRPLQILFGALGGVFLGIAISARASELIWIAPVMILIWLINIRKMNLPAIAFVVLGAVLGLFPTLYFNDFLFGNPIFGGYAEMNQSLVNIQQAGSDIVSLNNINNAAEKIKNSIFYFGLHPKFSLKMANIYFVQMFAYIFWPMLFGVVVMIAMFKKYKLKHWLWVMSLAITSFILILYYGSWEFHDNPDPSQFTIGNSYTRYWLPIYIMAIPLASIFIMRFTRAISSLAFIKKEGIKNKFLKNRANKKFLYWSLRIAALIFILNYSISFVLHNSQDGLLYLTQRQIQSRQEFDKILSLTEDNATIITKYHDKLLFPERKVIVGLFDDPAMISVYKDLSAYLPVYYYNFTFPQKDFDYLNNRRLKEAGLQIEKIEQITDSFTLYKLEPYIGSSTMKIIL